MKIALSFPEWLRLFTIVLHVPYNTAAAEREIMPLVTRLEPTPAERDAWGWRESLDPCTGATTYQMDTTAVQAWQGQVVRDFTPIEVERLRYFLDNPPAEMPWRPIEARLKDSIRNKLEVNHESVDS